ncbi:MAG TPA: peptidoglycan-binding protein [Acidimicrobiia bacterium]|nr:peptidoglycan-binding protein [Acidimicrobiia bacterium]
MRLYSVGDEGAAVRDIQERLDALGFAPGQDPPSSFSSGTEEAVREFQRARGLDVDGIVGPDTWRSLYEAGYRLGDRMLFLRRPMMRGEDVSELQSRLSSLGFDVGKVDGIFGPKTEQAVIDFQHNRDLAEDGKAGPEVVTEVRLVTRGEMREGRQAVREREWLRRLPPTVAGTRVYIDAGCRDSHEASVAWEAASAAAIALQDLGGLPVMSRSQDGSVPERLRAHRANVFGADLIVAFQLSGDGDDSVYFFASEHSRSEAGELLARALATVLGGKVEGRAGALLKETRAPAVVVSRGQLDEEVGHAVVDGLTRFFAGAAVEAAASR